MDFHLSIVHRNLASCCASGGEDTHLGLRRRRVQFGHWAGFFFRAHERPLVLRTSFEPARQVPPPNHPDPTRAVALCVVLACSPFFCVCFCVSWELGGEKVVKC